MPVDASWELTWMERFDFVNRANADYIDRLYAEYQRDPRSLDLTWQAYFAGFEYASGRNPMPPLASPRAAGENGKAPPGGPGGGGPGATPGSNGAGTRPELSGNA